MVGLFILVKEVWRGFVGAYCQRVAWASSFGTNGSGWKLRRQPAMVVAALQRCIM